MAHYGGVGKAETKVYDFFCECFSEETAKVVRQHSVAAAATAVIAAVPGAGTTACVLAQTTIVFSMYVRINRSMNIKISENKMKSLASAILGNIATNAVGYIAGIVASTALSLIPGVGSTVSTIVMGGLGYATASIAALVYGTAIQKMTESGKNMETMSESELKEALQKELNERDISRDFKNFSAEYKKGRKNGTISGDESVDVEEFK